MAWISGGYNHMPGHVGSSVKGMLHLNWNSRQRLCHWPWLRGKSRKFRFKRAPLSSALRQDHELVDSFWNV